ncbi:alpha/beta fold hydrolase [Microbacterium lacus]|uniref:alpha/beta fold hydrolase n=1 Tax=Microbacterium lacus TaxID=415217 RepID=UPI00384B5087
MSGGDSAKFATTDAAATPAGYVGGAGPDVVLLHGLGSRWQVFQPIVPELERTHRVHAFDLPGFGAEPEELTLRPGVAGLADWVTERLLSSGVEHAHVVGNSMGGAVALEIGRRGVASRVTAFAPSGFGSEPERMFAQTFLTAQRDLARSIPDRISAALRTSFGRRILLAPSFGYPTQVDPDIAIADMQALAGATAFDTLRTALRTEGPVAENPRVPTVIVWGRRDLVLPFLTQARKARRLYPHARHIALGGAGHLPFSDAPATCAALVTGTHPFVSATTRKSA